MRKRLCPQCKVSGLYLKNVQGDRLLVYVSDDGEVIPKDSTLVTDGFDFDQIFCLGCSWSGNAKRLVKR